MSSSQNSINTAYPIGGGSGGYPTQYGVLTGNGTNAVSSTVLSAGQVLIGTTSTAPVGATLTAGTGIAITSATGSITIAQVGTLDNWTTVSGTTQQTAINNGYIANNAGLVTLTLPTTAAIGSSVEIIGLGAGGWSVVYGSSQLIHFGNITSTTTTGSISSSNQYDSVTLVCIVANTTWSVTQCVSSGLTVV